jgi:hypothetical protein
MTSGEKQKLPDSTNGSELRQSKSKLIWLLDTLFSVLIAIGAYSKDSLFVWYFVPSRIFSVEQWTVVGSSSSKLPLGVYQSESGKNGEHLIEAQRMIYLNIKNESDEPQKIESILLEYKDHNDIWTPVILLDTESEIYFDPGQSTKLKRAALLDLNDMSLIENLKANSLAPHQSVSG